jgi:serine/threonine-protein kinase
VALTPGARLGPYEVLSAVGAGGMGEVYQARDTRLDRTVAIKVLASEIADDIDLRARFEREARTVAALDHPHICGIYDVGEANGTHFIVMPYLDGQSLAARLEKGPLPLDQTLKIATEIADALDKAHRQGITHRDLKPANIMVTRSGSKLLDFGLAKLKAPAGSISMSGMTQLATPAPATAHGTILGTVQYMAPEQVEGKEADARSDIWAFGAVLYEMATGTRPFQGDTPASVIGAILKDDPPPVSIRQPLAPSALDHMVGRCLAKQPDERWQSAADLRHQLAWIAKTSAGGSSSNTAHHRLRFSSWMVAAGAILLLGAAVVAFLSWSGATWLTEPTLRPAVRVAVDLGQDASLETGLPTMTLSPRGTLIVFVSKRPDGTSGLSTRRLDQSEATRLPGTEGAYAPFFSADGQWVGFFAEGKLKKTRVDGGEPVALCDAPAGRGGSWSEDGKIVAALDARGGLSFVTPDGGMVTSVTELQPGELSHRWPHILPGRKAVLFTVTSAPANYEAASIAVASLENNPEKVKKIVLANSGMSPRYLPTGHLAYVTKGTLYVVPFDLDRLEVRGTATSVLDELSGDAQFGSAQLDFSQSGTMLYRSGSTTVLRVVQWLTSDGKTESLWKEPASYQMPQLSPDGTRLAAVLSEGSNSDIWVYDWERGTRTRLTAPPGVNAYPVWSPDGQYIVFQSAGRLFWTRADGAERPQPLTKSQNLQFPSSFTADGKRLAFYEVNPGRGGSIQTVPIAIDAGQPRAGEPQLFRQTPSANSFPEFSPDGRWLAYASSESGIYEVYVRAFPDRGKQSQISTGGGNVPVWSRAGNELFYRTDDHRLMVTTYTVTGDSFVAGKTRLWSDKKILNFGLDRSFDLAPDGKRFAVVMSAKNPEPQETQRNVMLVLNFFDEVRRRVAAGGK